jgi:formylglycine-generating enzyme required for sulfatase activity
VTPAGVRGLAGGVREWTSSPYCSYGRKGCGAHQRVVRGGAFGDDDPADVLAAVRRKLPPDAHEVAVGVRCARDPL